MAAKPGWLVRPLVMVLAFALVIAAGAVLGILVVATAEDGVCSSSQAD